MIQLHKSTLELIDFSMVESSIILPPESDNDVEFDLSEVMLDYKVAGDFMIRHNFERDLYMVFTKISVNIDKELPGYVIMGQGMTIFKLNEKLSEAEIKNVLYTSAVPIAFNNMRSYFATTTAMYAAGSYQLPLFNLTELLRMKAERQSVEKPTVKKTASKKKTPAKKVTKKIKK